MDIQKTDDLKRSKARRIYVVGASIFLLLMALAAALYIYVHRGQVIFVSNSDIAIVKRGDVSASVTALGSVQPISTELIPAAVDGRVAAIKIQPGQFVRGGEVLLLLVNDHLASELFTARIHNSQAQSAVAMAKAQARADIESERFNVLKARTAEQFVKKEYEARLQVFSLGALSKMQLEESRAKLEIATTDVAAALSRMETVRVITNARIVTEKDKAAIIEQELGRSENDVSSLTIRAAKPGLISELAVVLGSNVTAGTPLLHFVDNSGYYIKLNVPEDQAKYIVENLNADINASDKRFVGKVKRIYPIAKAGYVTVEVVLDDQATGLPSIDSTVSARIHSAPIKNVLFVNAPSYVHANQVDAVYVKVNSTDRAIRRRVSFGDRVGDEIIVINGLAEGEHIITSMSEPPNTTEITFEQK